MTDSSPSPSPAPDDDFSWLDLLRRAPRWLWVSAYALLGLLLVGVLLVVASVVVLRQPLPQTDGTAELPGLGAEVEVVRDAYGIPQIYADSDADLMRAQGYVHAQERFFEMDLRRHVTAGRLSELFGERTLETDKMIRTMGWRRVAEAEWPLLRSDTRDALTAYAAGVNAYLADRRTTSLAAEYSVLRLTGLDYHPEPWTPVDSLAWLKAMAWDLRGNMDDEIQRVLLSLDLDADEVEELMPGYDAEARAPIVRGGGVVDGVFEQNATGSTTRNPARDPAVPAAAVPALGSARAAVASVPPLLGQGEGIGSNSWVVSGEHTDTGAPILANDPHLGVSQPGIWMQMGLHCRTAGPDCTLDTAGFTFSGVPGVIIGHNDRIAWGFTNLGPDVTDLFLEQVEGDDRWVQDGKSLPLEMRTETIEVRGGDDFELRVRSTEHGPLISDVSPEIATVGANAPVGDDAGERGNGYAVALAWTALTPAPTADAILGMNRAGNWEEFREAASEFAVPAQNLVYADVEGHIGYQAPGRIPIRNRGNDGRMPAEGWKSRNDWSGEYVPFEALPSVLDPAEGFVVTANQAVTGPDYPYFLGADFDAGYRAQRIRELIEERGELSVADMGRLQMDSRNPIAAELVPYLLDVELPRGYPSAGQRLLREWDFTQPADSAPAAYFNVVWRRVLEATFHDDLRRDAWPSGGSRTFQVVSGLLDQPRSRWWDDAETEEVETRDDVLREAMIGARDELVERQALDPRRWTWGHLHRLDLRHAALGETGIGLVDGLFNRTGTEAGGGSSLVDATNWDAPEGYGIVSAPSMRMVVSLADFDDSTWIDLTGVSGHPLSDHYDDQTPLWARGEQLPWAYGRDAVEAAARETLVLRPVEEPTRTP